MSDAREVLAKILREHWWDFRLARHEITAEWLLSALDEAGYVVVRIQAPVRRQEAVTLYEGGKSPVEIAATMGVTKTCVMHHLRKAGVIINSTRPDLSNRNLEILAAREGGETYTSIGKRYGLSGGRIRAIVVETCPKGKHKYPDHDPNDWSQWINDKCINCGRKRYEDPKSAAVGITGP